MRRSHDWTLCRSGLFDVAELSRCSANGRREVVETILMFTWGTQVRPPGCRGRRRSGCEQSHQDTPQKPDCPAIPSRISALQRFRRPALARTMCAVLAMGMQKATEGEERGLLNRSTWELESVVIE